MATDWKAALAAAAAAAGCNDGGSNDGNGKGGNGNNGGNGGNNPAATGRCYGDWAACGRSSTGGRAADTAASPLGSDAASGRTNGAMPKVNKGKLRVFFERKGRGGKSATIITGFDDLTDDQLKAVASKLKQTLGTGGSARGGEILIQGDRQADVKKYFGLKP